jgi:glyoxylate reductase
MLSVVRKGYFMSHVEKKYYVLADLPLAQYFNSLLSDIELIDWGEFLASTSTQTELAQRIQGLLTYGHPKVDSRLLDLLPNLRIISNHGVGVDHIDLLAARARNIPVAHTPGAVDGATADLAITLMLVTARQVIACNRFANSDQYRQPNFSDQQMLALRGCDVFGATLGIVGLGRIGKQIAKRARGFDMRIMYHRRTRDFQAEQELNAEYADLNSMLDVCDFVILSVPLDSSTHKLIGRAQLQRMKSSAILINVARGGVVDTDALVEALQKGWIRAAGLDVTDPEPLPKGHPLFELDNVTILPHIGSFTEQTRRRMAELTARQLLAGLEGNAIEHDATRPRS